MKRVNHARTSSDTFRLRLLATASTACLGGLLIAFASCAENESGDMTNRADGSLLPEASAETDGGVDADASSDAGCDAADDDCTTEIVPCESVAWCAVQTPLSVVNTYTSIWGAAANDIWAAGSGGTVVHYDGTTWTRIPTGYFNTFFSITGSGPNDIWMVSDMNTILHTTGLVNGAATFTNHPLTRNEWNTAPVRAAWVRTKDDVRLGGRAYDFDDPDWENDLTTGNAGIKITAEDGGVAWKQLPGTTTIVNYWGGPEGDLWYVGDNSVYVPHERGKIAHGVPGDGGAASGGDPFVWTSFDSQTTQVLTSVWGTSSKDVWAVGAAGAIRHFTGGARFDVVPSGVTVKLNAVWGTAPDDVWVVGDGGVILHYDGTTFTPSSAQLPLGLRPNLMGIWGSGPNDVWIVGDGVALHYTGPKAGAK